MAEEAGDVSAIASLPLEKFKQVTDSLIDELTGFVPIHVISDVPSEAKNTFTDIIIEALYIADDEERLTFLGAHFDGDQTTYLRDRMTRSKLELALALRRRHNAGVAPLMTDFGWRVKWVLGDSSSTVVKYPLLKLDVFVGADDAKKSEDFSLEMNKSELDVLLKALEGGQHAFV